MNEPAPEHLPAPGAGRKIAMVVILAVIAVTLTDIMVGVRDGAPAAWAPDETPRPEMTDAVFPVDAYLAMDGQARSPNSDWSSHLDDLVSDVELDEMALPVDPVLRQEVLDRAAARRAYPGARAKKPTPLLPHGIDGQTTETCLQCHGEGGRVIGRLVAPPLRHKPLANCGKCHVPASTHAVGE